MTELVRGIPPLLASHLVLVLVALAIATAISLPVAVAVSGRPRISAAVVTVAGVVQTIPGLALLALMVPVLAKTGWLSPFGFPPAVIALTLYAILPILRNAVTGLRGVDPAIVEAARGMGMSPAQIMRRVQLPLAAPVIAAGIRTATVWTVGAATLATPVGQACLGNYIFTGLQTRNFAMLLVGVAAATGLALVLDALLAAAEHALAGRRRRRVAIPVGLLAVLVVVVVGILPRLAASSGGPVGAVATAARTRTAITHVRLGGKTFTEQYVLVELMRARLQTIGVSVEVAQSLGSTVVFDALVDGDVDAYVEYSGTLWTNAMGRPSGPPRWQVLAELEGWLAHAKGVRSLGSLGFENTYALAVRRATADKLGLHTLADLAQHAGGLSIGGDYEFFGRAEWASVQRAYGLGFARTATFDPTLLYEAVARGEVDVISAFSSDGRIAANDLVVLADPAGALPPYDAMILLGPRIADDPAIACALGGLEVPVDAMRQANAMVDRDQQSPAAAAAWLLARLPPPVIAVTARGDAADDLALERTPMVLRLIEILRARDHVAVTCGLDDLRFHFTVWYQDVDLDALAAEHGDELLDRIAFHIAMFQINAVCSLGPDAIDLGPYARFATARFVDLWRTVFRRVWAQWRWEHDRPHYHGPAFVDPPAAPVRAVHTPAGPVELLAFCGGGKDSLVALKLLERGGLPFATLGYAHSIYGNAAHQHALLDRLGDATARVRAERQWVIDDFMDTPVLALRPELGVKSILAAETPASVFAALPVALARGYRGLVLAHEASANTGNLQWAGEDVNHQWGKGWDAEVLLDAYVRDQLLADVRYFSVLQPIHDEVIFELLARDAALAPLTHSCNVRKPWCGSCAKCAYVWLQMAAHLPAEIVDATFGANLGERPDNDRWFRELFGLAEHTPFECVGSAPEARLALARLPRPLGPRLARFADEIGPIDARALAQPLVGVGDRHGMPAHVADRVMPQLVDAAAAARRRLGL